MPPFYIIKVCSPCSHSETLATRKHVQYSSRFYSNGGKRVLEHLVLQLEYIPERLRAAPSPSASAILSVVFLTVDSTKSAIDFCFFSFLSFGGGGAGVPDDDDPRPPAMTFDLVDNDVEYIQTRAPT